MNDASPDYQLNQNKLDYSFESVQEDEVWFKPSVFTKIRNTNKKNKIKNQLITCNKEKKWKSNISPTQKTNPSTSFKLYYKNLYTYIEGSCCLGYFVGCLHYSHPCCPNQEEKFKQHKHLSMFVRRTIENNDEVGIRPNKIYESFVSAAGDHREISFIEKDL
ncbi:hypothetical protein Ahy_A04g020312 [Arachis hypogaea]|uniref:Uncharacterized protein n=1 Tax=Arachis hypogaea TaxID=3818 RepID=A0A445DHE1_ARAHY|nr:hypothetical protein Ahy_A04g020312 [Arachis hypogaea]